MIRLTTLQLHKPVTIGAFATEVWTVHPKADAKMRKRIVLLYDDKRQVAWILDPRERRAVEVPTTNIRGVMRKGQDLPGDVAKAMQEHPLYRSPANLEKK